MNPQQFAGGFLFNFIGYDLVAGELLQMSADPKIILINVLALGATEIGLIHNPPSGNHNPSSSEKRFTKNLVDVGKFLVLFVLDTIIIAVKSYSSLPIQV